MDASHHEAFPIWDGGYSSASIARVFPSYIWIRNKWGYVWRFRYRYKSKLGCKSAVVIIDSSDCERAANEIAANDQELIRFLGVRKLILDFRNN